MPCYETTPVAASAAASTSWAVLAAGKRSAAAAVAAAAAASGVCLPWDEKTCSSHGVVNTKRGTTVLRRIENHHVISKRGRWKRRGSSVGV
jgi:hypothetical protein